MSNIIRLVGKIKKERTIGDMVPGEIGYTVPWALIDENNIRDDYFIYSDRAGTATVEVHCVERGKYIVTVG